MKMGENTSKVFAGNSVIQTNIEAYGTSAPLFAKIITDNLTKGEYSLLDVGAFKGELLEQLISKLPDYKFHVVALDVNQEALGNNKVADEKIISTATSIPLKDDSIDISIMRYLLQWNIFEDQQKILKEVARVTKRIVIIEHAGADIEQAEEWRKRKEKLFSSIPKLARENYFFSNKKDIESILQRENIKYEIIRHRKIEKITDLYIERYNLNKEEAQQIEDIMGELDYFYQTDWLIHKN